MGDDRMYWGRGQVAALDVQDSLVLSFLFSPSQLIRVDSHRAQFLSLLVPMPHRCRVIAVFAPLASWFPVSPPLS